MLHPSMCVQWDTHHQNISTLEQKLPCCKALHRHTEWSAFI